MKYNKQILEAINRGVLLALDDFEDDNQLSSKSNIIKNIDTKELWNFYNNFVDLGLPSGTIWCKYNLGCDLNKLNIEYEYTKPKDWYGNYYAWGELTPKTEYILDNYRLHRLTKYNKKDGLTELLLEDDAAYQFDNRMKMPTIKLFEELLKYTTNKWIKNYLGIESLNGKLLTSKINGELMFIPAAGDKYLNRIFEDGSCCFLWSSSLTLNDSRSANCMHSNLDYICVTRCGRYCGFSVRPVLNRN